MSTSENRDRRRKPSITGPEMLEGRRLLTGGAGSTFAILPTSVDTAGGTVAVPFVISSKAFTLPKSGKLTLGIDVVAQSGSTVQPKLDSVTDVATKGEVRATQAMFATPAQRKASTTGNKSSASLFPLTVRLNAAGEASFKANISAKGATKGAALLGFYLAGDASGDGKVDATDIKAIKTAMGSVAGTTKYSFDADVNRDGKVTNQDLRIAKQNLGASTTISPVISANLDTASDTGLADRVTKLTTIGFNGTASPGSTVSYTEISGRVPVVATTADATGNYTITTPLGAGANTFRVSSNDSFGQSIAGNISPVTYDANAPEAITTKA
jgi:hypothetical protein